MTMGVVGRVIEDLQRSIQSRRRISEYLGEVRDDIVENVQAFRKLEGGPLAVLGLPVQDRAPSFGRY